MDNVTEIWENNLEYIRADLDASGTSNDDNQFESVRECKKNLNPAIAFLYGLPIGIFVSVLLLGCFVAFRNTMVPKEKMRELTISISANPTREPRGKKQKRGAPPSADLRQIDVNKMAQRDDAPDDIRIMAKAMNLKDLEGASKVTVKAPASSSGVVASSITGQQIQPSQPGHPSTAVTSSQVASSQPSNLTTSKTSASAVANKKT